MFIETLLQWFALELLTYSSKIEYISNRDSKIIQQFLLRSNAELGLGASLLPELQIKKQKSYQALVSHHHISFVCILSLGI